MTDLAAFERLVRLDHGLSVVATVRPDGTVQATVVNAGVVAHPVSHERVVAFVAGGRRKLTYLRSNPTVTVVVRAGWEWTTVEGSAQLIGPDDPDPSVRSEQLRLLLRQIFVAAGGTHEDWDVYDRVMAEEGRTAVLVAPARVYSNAGG